jgi:TolB-like protein
MKIRSMMPRFVTVLVMITLSFSLYAAELELSIKEIAKELATQLKEKAAKKIAVVSFSDLNGYESALSSFISEELITALFSEGKFDVVERRELDRVLQEQQKYTQNIFDKNTVAELQKLLGIDAIITGSITDLGEKIKLNTRAISVETGKVFAAASASIDKDKVIENLLQQSAASSGIDGKTPKTGLMTQPSDVYFKNAFIHVVPTSVVIQETGIVRITTEFRNITKKPLFLAEEGKNRSIFAATRSGDTFYQNEITGVESHCSYPSGHGCTVIAPDSNAIVVWDLHPKSGASALKGNYLTLRGNFYKYSTRNPEVFTVQLNGLRLN